MYRLFTVFFVSAILLLSTSIMLLKRPSLDVDADFWCSAFVSYSTVFEDRFPAVDSWRLIGIDRDYHRFYLAFESAANYTNLYFVDPLYLHFVNRSIPEHWSDCYKIDLDIMWVNFMFSALVGLMLLTAQFVISRF